MSAAANTTRTSPLKCFDSAFTSTPVAPEQSLLDNKPLLEPNQPSYHPLIDDPAASRKKHGERRLMDALAFAPLLPHRPSFL
ncbi:hypothetical protein HK105_207203 [Polyrhizophydium stewartii]|uniref:Uncharacterized protein n=1 Tax=Polyrhizophydium stewartii TaxID=2732419 RepID=A0ABR4N1D8_9FUNG|nr:hypothetical protein HK105_004602 [Polyrhizophydium stewartii]